MKAGILTFHEADNYGAVLQAYALQQTLGKLGADSEFVTSDAVPKAPETASGPAAIFMKKIQAEGAKRSALFEAFRNNSLRCAPRVPKAELKSCNEMFDAFIAGSDQIWNFRIPGADERYFLPFADEGKRYSYAASFGAEEMPAQAKNWCAAQLSKFTEISVREESGRAIVQTLTGRDACVCLDPTLLLEPSEWRAMATPAQSGEYVLLFLLRYDEELVRAAKEEAQNRGVELRTVTASFLPQFGFANWSGTGPSEWVGLFAGASCVFTNSFHGTVFSLMFERPLRVAKMSGELASRNGRIEELLARAGLAEALTGKPASLPAGEFAERIAEAKEASLQYLRKIIDHAKTV